MAHLDLQFEWVGILPATVAALESFILSAPLTCCRRLAAVLQDCWSGSSAASLQEWTAVLGRRD